jgi:hypothetical protein
MREGNSAMTDQWHYYEAVTVPKNNNNKHCNRFGNY